MQNAVSNPAGGNGGLIRVGGLAVLLAVVVHVLLNGVFKQFPPESPSLAELQAYLSSESGTWALVHGLRYPALVGLVLFAAGAYARTSRVDGQLVSGWGVVGLLGAAIQVTNAMVANAVEIVTFRDFSRLSENADLFWMSFYTGRVLFTAELTAWGLVAFGFSMAGYQSGRMPRWIVFLGFFSAVLGLASGVAIYSVLANGWAVVLADIASLGGLLWLLSVGVLMLLRGDR